ETSQIPTYAAHVPVLDSLIPDYGHQDDLRYPQLTYSLPNGLPVFRAATNGQAGVEQRVAQVQQTVGARRPAFLNFFIWNWGFHMPELERITKLLGPDF